MNVLVCTPGRLLQHMDETPGFDAGQIQALVLDEADRILDMGFSATLNAILQNLPQERQTMLFSATQTKSIKDLARLSLKAPEYIAVHADAAMPTPVKLQQVRQCNIMILQICMLSARAEAPCWLGCCHPCLGQIKLSDPQAALTIQKLLLSLPEGIDNLCLSFMLVCMQHSASLLSTCLCKHGANAHPCKMVA